MVVGARQSFQFFRQITWFLGNNRALSKFRYRILYNLIRITKLLKNHSVKANFKLTTRATLIVGVDHFSKWGNISSITFKCSLSYIMTQNIPSFFKEISIISLAFHLIRNPAPPLP